MGAPPSASQGAHVEGGGPPLVRHCLSANYSACKKEEMWSYIKKDDTLRQHKKNVIQSS